MHEHKEQATGTFTQMTCEVRERFMVERAAERHRALVAAWAAATIVALIATLTLVAGCGHSDRKSTRAANAHVVLESPAGTVVASNEPPHTYGAAMGEEAERRIRESFGAPESVPPDVVISELDTLVRPGQAIEVAVEGTSDVTEMALSDGLGDALPMVRDSVGGVWRVNYRVPLRPREERLAMSVTAKNEQNRWRRVWLFLNVGGRGQDVPTAPVTPDSSGSK